LSAKFHPILRSARLNQSYDGWCWERQLGIHLHLHLHLLSILGHSSLYSSSHSPKSLDPRHGPQSRPYNDPLETFPPPSLAKSTLKSGKSTQNTASPFNRRILSPSANPISSIQRRILSCSRVFDSSVCRTGVTRGRHLRWHNSRDRMLCGGTIFNNFAMF
jgi:hypothetical protein